jgi:3-oxoacyl-[acyl-carrier protein] reductase
LCARDLGKLTQVKHEIGRRTAEQKIEVIKADVSQKEDVVRLIAEAIHQFGRVDVLVNNAGVYGPKGKIEDIDWDAWVEAININLLGTVLTCKSILPHMKKNGYGKIINLSGGGATAPLPSISAYAASKAAVVRFTETLALECLDDGVDVNAIAPGALNTRLLDEILDAGPDKVGQSFYDKSKAQKHSGGTSLELGARLCVYLASSESDNITGKLISAVWDPWANLAERKQELAESDIYTLRRIVPADRGRDWGEPLK